jgi:universal stress protein A
MSRFEKILVPIDFSDHSKAALETALEIAPAFGAKIHLLHCYQLQPGAISPYGIELPANYAGDIRDAAAIQLKEWQEEISTDAVEIEGSLSSDFPSQAIALMAEELGSDLIVMGTRGLSGIKHLVLGSVAERTIRAAPCAVLTVKAPGSD